MNKNMMRATGQNSFFALVLLVFCMTTAHAQPSCRPFTVYTKNTQRSVTPDGPPGPLGDYLVASGIIYESPSESAAQIGVFDLTAFTTSVTATTERRQVFIETSFDKSYTRRTGPGKLFCGVNKNLGTMKSVPTDDLSLMGVETYPLGGGILTNPIRFGVSSGIGLFDGAEGSVEISFDPVTQFFTYTFTLLRR